MTENQIREEVVKHLRSKIGQQLNIFKAPKFGQSWSFKKEYTIQFGSNSGRADLVLVLNNKPFVIVECKRPGVINHGKEQLESYLNASRANLGIFANNPDPQKWSYHDNSIGFNEISLSTFWKKIKAAFDTELDIETQAQKQKQQRIETRASQLVTPEAIQARTGVIIEERAKKRVTENAIQGAVAQQLQEKIKKQESIINQQQTALDENRNRAIWGWILFGISVVLLIAVAANS